jgi:hypothetical protein
MTSNQFTIGNYYCFKDLSCVYSAYQGLPYGKEDQTLLIDNEPNIIFQNSKSNGFFLGFRACVFAFILKVKGSNLMSDVVCGQQWKVD